METPLESEGDELLDKQIKLLNERHLHYKVIDCIKNRFGELLAVPRLGEKQTTPGLRIDAKRKDYTAGQPDILTLNQTAPKGNGELNERQRDYLDKLKELNYKTLIINDYDLIVIELTKFYMGLRFPCRCCKMVFKSRQALRGHHKAWHQKET